MKDKNQFENNKEIHLYKKNNFFGVKNKVYDNALLQTNKKYLKSTKKSDENKKMKNCNKYEIYYHKQKWFFNI